MAGFDQQIEHLLRRAGFGARPDEMVTYRGLSLTGAISRLLNYEQIVDDVDQKINTPGYAQVTARGASQPFSPQANILDARQRWLFRMVHSDRPLQEKMTLFWHNHFATAYTKIAGTFGAAEGARYMAAKPSENAGRVRGQIEMLRDNALGNFRDLLVEIAKDTAMLVWLDGRTNTRARPQENFAREIMELFTLGVGNFTEADVYAAARVFTGWNLTRPGVATDGSQRYEFFYNANQHDTGEKTFSFAIYPDGGKTIPARAAAQGMQDGLDFIDALAASPHTARYLSRKLYRFFVSEFGDVAESFVDRISRAYLQSRYDMKWVMREVLLSPEFWDQRAYFARYASPVEYVVRLLKDVGWVGFSLTGALAPLSNMSMNLFDPPDVAGWEFGRNWFSTGSMLARMNFGSTLAANQRLRLVATATPYAATPDALLSFVLESMRTAPLGDGVVGELSSYLRSTGAWTGSRAQLEQKVPGLVHLVASTSEYQLV
jgi:uncharacterized protein (DUF1800 family)